ncbi:hypothetical protein C9439_05045, partial [archaeon SCG-AAA382B04]
MSVKKWALVVIVVGVVVGLATVPGVWHYTESNSFCADCHENMGFGTSEAVSAGLAKDHYGEYFDHPEIACEECHRGPGLGGMVDVKVIQAVHEVYQYFVLHDRDFPKSGTYPSENCMKEDCHPVPGDVHNASISAKECRDCHSGHHNVHDSARKVALLGSIDCTNCHSNSSVPIHQKLSKDCQDCHSTEGVVLTHQDYETSQNCQECHEQNHPTKYEECQGCHEDKVSVSKPYPGYEGTCESCHGQTRHNISVEEFNKKGVTSEVCLSCHPKTHGNATSQLECFSCHKNIVDIHYSDTKQLNKAPYINISSDLCSECHGSNVHLQHPSAIDLSSQCKDCHSPTHGGPNSEDCERCHEDLAISAVSYPASTSNDFCGQCHNETQSKLQEDGGKHTQIKCTSCHEKHEQIPNCSECHGEPHGPELTNCYDCHP